MRSDCAYARRTGRDDMSIEDYLSLPHAAPSQILPGYHGTIDSFLENRICIAMSWSNRHISACCLIWWRKPTWC